VIQSANFQVSSIDLNLIEKYWARPSLQNLLLLYQEEV